MEITREEFKILRDLMLLFQQLKLPLPAFALEIRVESPVIDVLGQCEPVELNDDEVLIKSWSENVGIKEALIDAGIIGPLLERIPTGWVSASKHKLLKQ